MKRKGFNLLAIMFLSVLMMFAVVVPKAFAELPVLADSFNADSVQEINQALYSNGVTQLGDRLRGPLQRGYTTFTTLGEKDLDETDTVIFFDTAAGGGTSETAFGEGFNNQVITFVLVTDNGNTVDISFNTSTGFSSIIMQDAKDSCSFKYTDSTKGWFLLSNSGCTIN